MKKVLMAMVMVLMFSSYGWGAAATLLTAASINTVSKDDTLIEYTYSLTTVANGAKIIYKIPSDGTYGAIQAISIYSASDDLDILVSQVDLVTTLALATADTVIAIDGANLFFAPSLENPVVFRNGDSPQSGHLYLTVDNTGGTAPTGASGLLRLVYKRY